MAEEKEERNGTASGVLTRWLGVKGPEARRLTYLLLLGGLGMLILLSDTWFGTGPAAPAPARGTEVRVANEAAAAPDAGSDLTALESRLARDLQTTLSQVAGAGRVQVTVTLESGPAQVLAVDAKHQTRTVQERDTTGGTRTTADQDESSQTVVVHAPGGDSPLVLRRERPKVAGVLVVAEGARSSRVQVALTQAAAAALGIYPHRVTVMPMSER